MRYVKSLRREAARANLLGRRAIATRIVGRARREGAKVEERTGVTVITVTWNSLPFLEGFLEGVRRNASEELEILVVDNHSDDGTREFLLEQSDVRTIRTPLNIGHGLGLDLGVACARTTSVVTLDVDAFPISPAWLPAVLEPLEQGAVVAGAYVQRAFIHPSYLAIRRADYYGLNLRFVPVGVRPQPGDVPRGVFMDVGEALCQTVAVVRGSAALHRIPISSTRGEGLVGAVYGDVVYHNFFSTQGPPELMEQSRDAWDEAVSTYLRS